MRKDLAEKAAKQQEAVRQSETKTSFWGPRFLLQNDRFTKTGLGQTNVHGKLKWDVPVHGLYFT